MRCQGRSGLIFETLRLRCSLPDSGGTQVHREEPPEMNPDPAALLDSSSDFKEPPTQGLHFQLLPGGACSNLAAALSTDRLRHEATAELVGQEAVAAEPIHDQILFEGSRSSRPAREST